jgi:hypothetical protein
MWKVYFCNFWYFSANEGRDLKEAVAIAKRAGFSSQIYDPSSEIVATWCPMVGLRMLDRKYAA